MRVGKKQPALGQAIHIRRLRLRVPETSHPVIPIIHRNKKHIRPGRGMSRLPKAEDQKNVKQSIHIFPATSISVVSLV